PGSLVCLHRVREESESLARDSRASPGGREEDREDVRRGVDRGRGLRFREERAGVSKAFQQQQRPRPASAS
ncbi:hypothetical protein THAOC_19237, partial [Thalassiosira oceanica]